MSIELAEILLLAERMFTGNEDHIRKGWGVLVHGKKILAVEPQEKLLHEYPDAQRIDLGNRTILPGLIDAHRHILGKSGEKVTTELMVSGTILGVIVAKETLEDGITTVRDPGCRHYGIFTLKRAIEDGLMPGPQIYASGPNPTGRAAPQSWRNCYVRGPWSMRNEVRKLVEAGADWIKIIVSQATEESDWKSFIRYLTDEEILAAVEEAHTLGRRISCHVEGLEAAKAVIRAGVDAIEHGTVLDEVAVKMMVDHNVCLVPTLSVFESEGEPYYSMTDKRSDYESYLESHRGSFRLACDAGVTIAAGTDVVEPVPPRGSLAGEIERIIQDGMSTFAALQSATTGGSVVLGIAHQTGTLEPGKLADIIAIQGDPLEQIQALKSVDFIMKQGKIYRNC